MVSGSILFAVSNGSYSRFPTCDLTETRAVRLFSTLRDGEFLSKVDRCRLMASTRKAKLLLIENECDGRKPYAKNIENVQRQQSGVTTLFWCIFRVTTRKGSGSQRMVVVFWNMTKRRNHHKRKNHGRGEISWSDDVMAFTTWLMALTRQTMNQNARPSDGTFVWWSYRRKKENALIRRPTDLRLVLSVSVPRYPIL